MKKRKIIKAVIITVVIGIIGAGVIGYYMFNKPHRNVQNVDADYALSSSQVVTEYLTDKIAANEKYLSADGDSKILAVTGTVNKISDDFNGQKVVLLKNENDKAGVSCSFTKETNGSVAELKIGQTATIKSVIRSGASYDDDLEMFENVILEKSNLLNAK